MKSLYLVSGMALKAIGPIPGAAVYDFAGDWHVLIVEQWLSHDQQDQLEAFSNTDVVSLQSGDYAKPVPVAMVTAFANSKIASVSLTDTIESALWKIRAQCAAARP